MCPVVELEIPALLRALDAPAGENARDVDHVLLRVAAVHAQRVELEQLPGVVLIDPFGHPFESARSEERRVGKECRDGWAADDGVKRKNCYNRRVVRVSS